MVQQRRGLLRVWNLSLVIATFSLTILGTFLTRSGVIQSVHTFSESTIGPLLIGFFALVLVVGVGLIAWRGDRLRSPGGIDAPLSREGAFLGNNLLFVAFAFVVLLGTVFPLLYQALNSQQVTVGAPYFNALAVPLGLALLFLMGVAPALPWRKTTLAVMRGRMAVPAALGVVTVVACVLGGVHGLEPLVAFGLGAFAAASAGRALVLSVRLAWRAHGGRSRPGPGRPGRVAGTGRAGQRRHGRAHRRGGHRRGAGRGHLVRTARGAPAVARPDRNLRRAHRAVRRLPHREHRRLEAQEAVIRVDGGGDFRPAITTFGSNSANAVGTPSIDSGWRDDVYLTIDKIPLGLDGGHRRGRPAPGRMDVGRGSAAGGGHDPVGRPRAPSPSHRPGVQAGRGCGRHAWPGDAAGDGREVSDALVGRDEAGPRPTEPDQVPVGIGDAAVSQPSATPAASPAPRPAPAVDNGGPERSPGTRLAGSAWPCWSSPPP